MINLNKLQATHNWAVLLFRSGATTDNSLLKEYKFGEHRLFLPVKFNLLQYVDQVAQVISAGKDCDPVVQPGSFVAVHHFVAGTAENFIEELENGDHIRRCNMSHIWARVDISTNVLTPVEGQLYCDFLEQRTTFVDADNWTTIENFVPTLNKYSPLRVEAVNPVDAIRYDLKKGDDVIVDMGGVYDIDILGKKRFRVDTSIIVGKVVENSGRIEVKSF